MDHIKSLPTQDEPEVFGMHANANIAYLKAQSKFVIEQVLASQPRNIDQTEKPSNSENYNNNKNSINQSRD